jgi:cell cycle sensor histidine kinase DivJ
VRRLGCVVDSLPETAAPARLGEALRPPMADAAAWSAGWAVAAAATAAALLVAAGAISARILLALAFMALPGIIGATWRPSAGERSALVAVWSLGAAVAVCLTGGLSGPLAVLCVTPVLVCLVIDAPWRAGAGWSIAAAAVCALLGFLHQLPSPPAEPGRMWLTLIELVVTAIAAGGALLVARRRAEDDRDKVEAELTEFQTLMGDLPELAMLMDAEGRVEVVFGQPLEGLDVDLLHQGLAAAAAPVDRPMLEAAMRQAFAQGSAQAFFDSLSAPDQRIVVTLQRTGVGGLAAILRKAPPPALILPLTAVTEIAAAPIPEDLAERLTAAETGRREAEAGRDRAEATAAARALFLANMSHELRTPLNAIMGFSDMMRARMFGALTPKYAEYAELIHESGGHLLDLINDVLDMSKIEAQRYTLSREVFDVRDALNAALRLVRLQADEVGVKLRAVLPAEPLTIDADKRAIKQIALNLLSNALKFTPKDGTVILSAQAAAGVLEIVVADTGMGIAAEDLKRLGQPFEQAGAGEDRARGTGLGLSLVDAFAKLHGGTLTLESRLGEGTAATVRMPVLAAPQPIAIDPTPVVEAPAPEPLPEPPAGADPTPERIEPPSDSQADSSETSAPAPAASVSAGSPTEQAVDMAVEPAPRFPPGSLDERATQHHGLRQTVVDLFAHRPARGPQT